jgi:arsenate reductase (glutaredoxin)
MTTIYGIKNCQTVQKALKFLDENQIQYEFWDYKKQGIDKEHLEKWCREFGWQKVLNRDGMMWRKASEEDKNKVVDQNSAIEFMLQVPTSIKRPIVEIESELLIGFVESDYVDLFVK